MKKVVELHNLVTGAPLTGKDITLVRVFPDDAIEVDLVEIGTSGSYLASTIDYGVYKVYDRTAGSPGVDLDQLVDMASSMASEPALPASGSGMLHSDRAFRNATISEVDGLAAALAAKQTTLDDGTDGEFYAAPGKTPRRIVSADILDLPIGLVQKFSSSSSILAIEGSDYSCTIAWAITEVIKGECYLFTAKVSGSALTSISVAANNSPLLLESIVDPSESLVCGRLTKMLEGKGDVFSGTLNKLNFNATGPVFQHQSSPAQLKVNPGAKDKILINGGYWFYRDLANSITISGVING